MPVRDLPRPRNWQDFEDLALDLFRALWQSPMASKNGRSGQPQAGVDVFGQSADGARWFGVQCKKKFDQPVTAAELEGELAKAQKFNPTLSKYILATTAPRDAAIQERARELSTRTLEVAVFAWDDVCEALDGRTDLLRKHFPDVYGDDPSDLRRHYLRHLVQELDVVPVSKVNASDRHGDIPLSSVYIDLNLNPDEVWAAFDSRRALEPITINSGMFGSRLRALPTSRIVAALTAVRFVASCSRSILVGRGGTGKSTFGRYLCLCLAGEQLGDGPLNHRSLSRSLEPDNGPTVTSADPSTSAVVGAGLAPARVEEGTAPPTSRTEVGASPATPSGRGSGQFVDDSEPARWPHDDLLPFFVELRRFVRHDSFPAEAEEGQAKHLSRYLATLGPTDGMSRLVLDGLERGALVVFDGLDEVPAADAVREGLEQVIVAVAGLYPKCRLLLTSRPHAYRADRGVLHEAGFVAETLAPFSWEKIQRFVREAYAAFAQRNRLAEDGVEALSRDLLVTLRDQVALRELAAHPLLLTMITDLHAARGGRLPSARAELFEQSVELLFDRWNERRLQGDLGTHAGMTKPQIRSALELVAYRAQRDGAQESDGAADVPESVFLQALVDTRKRYGVREPFSPEEIRDYLNERSGILLADSPTLYRFPHRLFQEYLAACHLDHFDGKRAICLEADPSLWRETLLFLAGRLVDGDGIWRLLHELLPAPPPREDKTLDQTLVLRALIAALIVRENRLDQREEVEHRSTLETVRLWLRRIVEVGALEVVDRAEVGRVLGLLGDDRPGVGLVDNGLPDIEWVEIPAGTFIAGGEVDDEAAAYVEPRREEELPAFRIARYLVTHRHYQAFLDDAVLEDGGASARWEAYWTPEGLAWRAETLDVDRDAANQPLDDPPFDLPNHPRVVVSYHEASAFCAWLSHKTGLEIRLPTALEWERAVRGTDGREYPWGAGFDARLCNSEEANLGATTAVGLFPRGASPPGSNGIGLLDPVGNVMQLCSDIHGPSGETIDVSAPGAPRALRGSSWISSQQSARCAYRRHAIDPGARDRDIGFRVVTSSR
ncbi:MAG: SUMF1/EgtB/PvdO family nonheme iron enzyme [Acidobacteriota bacterium]